MCPSPLGLSAWAEAAPLDCSMRSRLLLRLTRSSSLKLQLQVRALPVDSVVWIAYTNVGRFSAQWVEMPQQHQESDIGSVHIYLPG